MKGYLLKKKVRLDSVLVIMFAFFLLFALPGQILAEADLGISESTAQEAGLSTGTAQVSPNYEEGKHLGYMYLMVDTLSVNGDYLIEPVKVPLYKGERLSRLLNYQFTAHEDDGRNLYRNREDPKRDGPGKGGSNLFTYDGESLDSSDFAFKKICISKFDYTKKLIKEDGEVDYLDEIKSYAEEKSYALADTYEGQGGFRGYYLADGTLNKESQWLLFINGKEINKSPADCLVGREIKDGDVVRLTYSIFGQDREYESKVSRDPLIKALAQVGTSGWDRFYFENKEYKETFDNAKNSLKKLNVKQEELDQATSNVQDTPEIDKAPLRAERIVNYESQYDYLQDFLLSNLQYEMKVGEEMEIFNLDLPRASDQNENFQREDLILEPVIGGDKIEIRKDVGEKLTVRGEMETNTKDGAVYYARGLKEGLVVLRVYHPGFNGRPNYMVIYLSNRDSDYGIKRIPISSNLDDFTKYDVLHFNEQNKTYPVEFKVSQGAGVKLMVNGKKINLEKTATVEGKDIYKSEISPSNYWTTVFFTAEKDGKKTSKIYHLRSAYLEYEIHRAYGKTGAPRAGEKTLIKVSGLLTPLPKIGKFYNPGVGLRYFLPVEGFGFFSISPWQYNEFQTTIPGEYKLIDGKMSISMFGIGGFAEVPVSQMPKNAKMNKAEIISQSGGINYPQTRYIFKSLPNYSMLIKENEHAEAIDYIQVKSDKGVYSPGEEVTLKIDISDEFLDKLNQDHKIYITPRDKNGIDNSANHNSTKQINKAELVFASNIPGLQEIRTHPPVHTAVEGTDQFNLSAYTDVPANDPIFHLEEKRAELERLRTLTFTLPENTPEGTYNLIGNQLEIRFGPVWGMLEESKLQNKIGSVNIQVRGQSLQPDPAIKELRFKDAKILFPASGIFYVGEENPQVRTAGSRQSLEIISKHPVDQVKMFGQDGKEIGLEESKKGFVTQNPYELKEGLNRFEIQVKKGSKSIRYTLEVMKGQGEFPEKTKPGQLLTKSLEDWIAKGEGAAKGDYSDEDYKALQEAVGQGKEILASNPSQKEIDQAVSAIEKAYNRKKPDPIQVDTKPLEDWIAKGKKATKEDYLEKDFRSLLEAIAQGERVLGSNPSQKEIDQAVENIQRAFYKKKPEPGEVEEESYVVKGLPGHMTLPKGLSEEDFIGRLPQELILTNRKKEKSLPLQWDINGIQRDEIGHYTALGFYKDPIDGSQKKVEIQVEVVDGSSGGEGQDLAIGSLDPKALTIDLGQEVRLPETAEVLYPDNIVKDYPVKWDLSSMDWKKPGTYFIPGELEGYSARVEQMVVIRPLEEEKPVDSLPKPPSSPKFRDINGHWAEDAILRAVEKGYFSGVDLNHFAPNRPASRGELVTVLGRMAGIDPSQYTHAQAPDIDGLSFYGPYANWAIKEGIAQGFEDGSFQGGRKLNREEMAQLLTKTIEYMEIEKEAGQAIHFQDQGQISAWASPSVDYLTSRGLLNGRENGKFAPKARLTRAEVAQIISNVTN